MARRSLLPFLLLPLVACEEEPVSAEGLEARLEGRLERDPTVPSGWTGRELLTVLDATGALLCEDEIPLEGVDRDPPCDDCTVTVDVLLAGAALRCVLSDREGLARADGRSLGFVPTSRFGSAVMGWLESAAEPEGPWESYAEGLLSPDALSWHLEVPLEHTTAAELEGGPSETTSGGPLSR